MFSCAAAVHDRVARMLDEHGATAEAREHREAATKDRAAADEHRDDPSPF